MGITIRYPYEVRDEKDYFDDIPNEKITGEMLELASHIVKTKLGHFHPEKFEDRYEEALKDLIKRKSKGEKLAPIAQKEPSNVVNLMDALRASVKGEKAPRERRKPAREHHRAAKKSGRSSARHRKAS
jgi:Ku protein